MDRVELETREAVVRIKKAAYDAARAECETYRDKMNACFSNKKRKKGRHDEYQIAMEAMIVLRSLVPILQAYAIDYRESKELLLDEKP